MICSYSDGRNHKLLDLCVEAVEAAHAARSMPDDLLDLIKEEIDQVSWHFNHPGVYCRSHEW